MNRLVAAACRIAIASTVLLTTIGWSVEARAAQLTLTWAEASTDELGFSIERSVGGPGTFGEITTTEPSTTTYVDLNLAAATTYCYRVRAFNGAGYSDYSNTACATTAQAFGLAVLKTGAGTGTVSSVPAGITCGPSCSGTYASGTAVTLTASAASGSTFTGWSGGGCTGTGTCVVTVTATTTVTANFAPQTVALSVSKTGTGAGTVTSAPAGITCGVTCSSTFATGTSVTLSASPAAGSTFSGWSGAGCSGAGTCSVSLSAATTVTATFALQPVALTVAKAGAGTGTVTSVPAGINCGLTCVGNFPGGSSVTLSASSGPGSVFSGWSGGGCSGTGACSVALSAATAVTATFNLQPVGSVTLTVDTAGGGSGTVTSAPSGIACGATCSWAYPSGSIVTLTASAASGSAFTGWSGGGCAGTEACVVTLLTATTVTANFAVPSATLTVTMLGSGTGTIASTPSGIACAPTCVWTYPSDTSVTLTATPGPGSVFADWSGGGCTGAGACVTTVAAATSISATFNLVPSTSFSDDFERADSTELGMGWTEAQGDFFVRSDTLWNGTEETRHIAVQSALPFVTGTLKAQFMSVNNNAAPAFGLVFGFVNTTNYYAAYRQLGGTSLLKIVRVTDGIETVIAQRAVWNPPLWWKFNLSVSVSPTQIVVTGGGRTLSATGVSVAPGKVGLMVEGSGSSHAIDNFEATP